MSTFKNINKSSIVSDKRVISYKHTFTTSSAGIDSKKIVSGSINNKYWQSLNVLFYTSGSPSYTGEKRFNFDNLSLKNSKQYLKKFHGYPSCSIFDIPQVYYGEKITPKSFKLTDLNNTDNNSNNPIIKDDGYGNLYSTNAQHSQSVSSLSSSDNYVGNIFYERGIAVITETGSWSGSVNYSDIGTNFTIELDSHNTTYTNEYDITMKPSEFNYTMNYTARMPLSGTFNTLDELTASIYQNPYLAREFTSASFQPYITHIHLYQKGDYDTPVMTAAFPKPIRKSDKIDMTFKIKYDF